MQHHLSEKSKENIYFGLILIIHILYLLTFLGVAYINKQYIKLFNVIVQIGICSILILRFNPYNDHKITDFDKTLIISASSFLLFNLFITEVYSAYIIKTKWFNNVKTDIMSYI